MTQKGNLAKALQEYDNRKEVATQSEAPKKTVLPQTEKTSLPPSRQGKKAITGYFNPEVAKQLKAMAVAQDTTTQALLEEALNDLFKKYSKPHIA